MSRVKIIADSLHPNGEDRFTTFLINFPKCLLAELNTHRMLVRNVGSSRAVPFTTMVNRVLEDPFIPKFDRNQKGMSGKDDLTQTELGVAVDLWMESINDAIRNAEALHSIGIHKQTVNRIIEPYLNVELVLSGTEWENLFNLRCHPQAQPNFKLIAEEMRDCYNSHTPIQLEYGEWHIPFGEYAEGLTLEQWIQVAIARVARVSYQSHSGEFSIEKDMELFNNLYTSRHLSPFEHIAKVVDNKSATVLDFVENRILTSRDFIDPKVNKYLFYDENVEYLRWSRNYSGFYTYRHHLEDNVLVQV